MSDDTIEPREPVDGAIRGLAASDVATARWLWRNGQLVPWDEATVHITAVGHSSVAAVFEGIKAYRAAGGQRLLVFRLDEHVDRLFASARICRTRIPYSAGELRDAVLDVLRANEYRDDTYIRPWAFPSGLIREQMVPAAAVCEVVIDTWSFASQLFTAKACRAAVSSWVRVGDSAMPPRAKAFSNYHNGRLAVIEAKANGHDWPILLNDRHQVSEGAGACIALVRRGTVVTPPLTAGVLESVTRATALTLLADAGVPVEERTVDRTELYLADEIFFLGTAWEVLPVGVVDGLPVGDGEPGPVTRLLQHAYHDVVRGVRLDHPDWITEVPR
ncbi:branched-chain-amino-acid transaminase [Micromonospora sp. NPDC051227]|uniref:branched-chain-amino-acid transaminase n=1 Tax=Micromonospora sp. NPDC051227 TaxID=3364285 RepID=UPI0037BD531D